MSSRETIEALERQDLVAFVGAALSCTGQDEFYGDAKGQAVSIGFFHEYMLGSQRRMYAHCLALGINDYNRALIIVALLCERGGASDAERREEGRLIAAALRRLPPPRVYRSFETLVERGVHNRRTRRIVADYLAARPEPELHAVKYRRRLARIAAHFHLRLADEESALLFGHRRPRFDTPLFEAYRRARYDQGAIYELPYTVAEGLAARHGIPRATFLRGIAPQLTRLERLRLQSSGEALGVDELADLQLAGQGLTRLAIYFLSLAIAERRRRFDALDAAMREAARRVAARSPRLGRVALVADSSYSAGGSRDKRDRPLALSLAAHYLIHAMADDASTHWTSPPPTLAELQARGHTDLATPILAALEREAELVVILSDGYDNDPPGGAAELLRVYRQRIDRERRVAIVHLSPAYDASSYTLRAIHPSIPTLGIRDAEDIPTLLAFVRFAEGSAKLDELQRYFERQARALVGEAEGA